MIAEDGHVLSANSRFLELWRVPPSLAAAGQDDLLLAHVLEQLLILMRSWPWCNACIRAKPSRATH